MSETNEGKRRVFLSTLSLEGGDEDGIIEAAWNAFMRTFGKAWIEDPDEVEELHKTTDTILQAMSDGSSEFVFSTRGPSDRTEIMDSFSTDVLPWIRSTMKDEVGKYYNGNDRTSNPGDDMLGIGVFHEVKCNTRWSSFSGTTPMKDILKSYADGIDSPLNSLRFTYQYKPIFFSELRGSRQLSME